MNLPPWSIWTKVKVKTAFLCDSVTRVVGWAVPAFLQGKVGFAQPRYKSISNRRGSSSASFTRTRNVTPPLPSTMRWS